MKTRKELLAEFKARKPPMGVFLVRNLKSGKIFFDSGIDVQARWNRHRFQLDLGIHPNAGLQADWKALGAEAFQFEQLTELQPRSTGSQDYHEELSLLESVCRDECYRGLERY